MRTTRTWTAEDADYALATKLSAKVLHTTLGRSVQAIHKKRSRLRIKAGHRRKPASEITIEEKFWPKVWPKVWVPDGCWEWIGATDVGGYGIVSYGVGVRAHRVSWELHYGKIPKGLHVCHKCDNPGCVRPDHLFLGTRFDNMRDAARKGRTKVPKPHRYYLRGKCESGW